MSNITIVTDQYAWENRFRPDNLDEIVLPSDVRAKIHGYVTSGNGNIPSMLFYSPQPGTGKTTSALAVCNEIGCIKPLMINASLDNSIDVIRDRVIQYATGVSVFGGRKVVILDEVERLSMAAQESLKGIVEKVSKNCSFILTTNAKQRVNEPLRSRCREIDFIWSEKEADEVKLQFMRRCATILTEEGIPYEAGVIASIVKAYFPDNRKIMGTLQDNATTFGKIDERALAQVKAGEFQALVDFLKTNDWAGMKQWVTDNQNYITEDFYSRFFHFCVPQNKEKTPLIQKESIPDLVCVCGQSQIEHRSVGDVWLHGVYFLTNVMLNIKWK
ncbi:sliding clamp holder [Salmonella phage vB_SenM_UTK0004]|nr:sliding clamp holder [Salmonella phage vB_SenM_UTK0004]